MPPSESTTQRARHGAWSRRVCRRFGVVPGQVEELGPDAEHEPAAVAEEPRALGHRARRVAERHRAVVAEHEVERCVGERRGRRRRAHQRRGRAADCAGTAPRVARAGASDRSSPTTRAPSAARARPNCAAPHPYSRTSSPAHVAEHPERGLGDPPHAPRLGAHRRARRRGRPGSRRRRRPRRRGCAPRGRGTRRPPRISGSRASPGSAWSTPSAGPRPASTRVTAGRRHHGGRSRRCWWAECVVPPRWASRRTGTEVPGPSARRPTARPSALPRCSVRRPRADDSPGRACPRRSRPSRRSARSSRSLRRARHRCAPGPRPVGGRASSTCCAPGGLGRAAGGGRPRRAPPVASLRSRRSASARSRSSMRNWAWFMSFLVSRCDREPRAPPRPRPAAASRAARPRISARRVNGAAISAHDEGRDRERDQGHPPEERDDHHCDEGDRGVDQPVHREGARWARRQAPGRGRIGHPASLTHRSVAAPTRFAGAGWLDSADDQRAGGDRRAGARPARRSHADPAARGHDRAARDPRRARPAGRRHRPPGRHVAGDLLPVLPRRRGRRPRAAGGGGGGPRAVRGAARPAVDRAPTGSTPPASWWDRSSSTGTRTGPSCAPATSRPRRATAASARCGPPRLRPLREGLAAKVEEGQVAGLVAAELSPIAAASALASMLERMAAFHVRPRGLRRDPRRRRRDLGPDRLPDRHRPHGLSALAQPGVGPWVVISRSRSKQRSNSSRLRRRAPQLELGVAVRPAGAAARATARPARRRASTAPVRPRSSPSARRRNAVRYWTRRASASG